MRTLCAMLNHRGGRVLFGVDADGRVNGQQVSDHTIEEIAREIKELDPPVFPTIDRVEVGAVLSNFVVVCDRDLTAQEAKARLGR